MSPARPRPDFGPGCMGLRALDHQPDQQLHHKLDHQLDHNIDSHFLRYTFFSITMADNHYDNYLEDFTLCIGKVQLKGFVSKQGIANFLNIPYARVPVRFRTAVPILISAHNRCLDVSRYGPRCPQKADGLQASIAHVFEKTSLSQAPDETNCLHLNIYVPHATTCLSAHSSLPVFVWIHGGAFNIGDNSTQFGMFCICAKQTYR
jgi:hypothetical protein